MDVPPERSSRLADANIAMSSRPSLSNPPSPWPVDQIGAIERPPDDDRLQRQSRSVIEPAAAEVGQVDAVDGMLEVRRPDAERIGRQCKSRPPAQGFGDQCGRA